MLGYGQVDFRIFAQGVSINRPTPKGGTAFALWPGPGKKGLFPSGHNNTPRH